MRISLRARHGFFLVAGASILLAFASSSSATVLFQHTFDGPGLTADFAVGDPDPVATTGTHEFLPAQYDNGVLVANPGLLRFSATDNVNWAQGTISLWFRPTVNSSDLSGELRILVINQGTDGATRQVDLYYHRNSESFRFWDSGNGSGGLLGSSAVAFSAGDLISIGVSWGSTPGEEFKELNINGGITSNTATGWANQGANNMWIGTYINGTNRLPGIVDNLWITDQPHDYQFEVIPEPGTAVMLLLGLGLAVFFTKHLPRKVRRESA